LVKQGSPVTKQTVQNLLEMSFGAHVIRNPDAAGKMKKSDAVPNMRQTTRGGGHVNSPGQQQEDGKPPVPREPETVKAIEGISKYLNEEVKKAAKK